MIRCEVLNPPLLGFINSHIRLTQEMILGLYFPSGLSVKQVTQHVRILEQLRKADSPLHYTDSIFISNFQARNICRIYVLCILNTMTNMSKHHSLTGSLGAIFSGAVAYPCNLAKRSCASGNRPIDPNYAKWFGSRQKCHICQICLCNSLLSDGNIFPYLG